MLAADLTLDLADDLLGISLLGHGTLLWPVSALVNNPRNDAPEYVDPVRDRLF
jgi:hypothetical protein